jgi:hypothetical protein
MQADEIEQSHKDIHGLECICHDAVKKSIALSLVKEFLLNEKSRHVLGVMLDFEKFIKNRYSGKDNV